MQLLTFWTQLLMDPVGFSELYFKDKEVRSSLDRMAHYVYFTPFVVLSLVTTLGGMFRYGGFSLLGPLAGFIAFIPVGVIVFGMHFFVTKWLLRGSISFASYEQDKRKVDNLSVYILACGQAIFLALIGVYLFGGIVISWLNAFVSPTLGGILGVLLVMLLPLCWLRSYYIQYMLVRKWMDGRALESVVAFVCLRLLFYYVPISLGGALWRFLALSALFTGGGMMG